MDRREGCRRGGRMGGAVIARRWKLKEDEYNSTPNHCENCQCNLDWQRKNNKFCSNSCATTYNNKRRTECKNKNKTKCCKCSKCSNYVEINIRCSHKFAKCSECKERDHLERHKCKCCGQQVCLDSKKCAFRLIPTLLKLGFNPDFIGNVNYYKEFDRIVEIIKDMYYIENMSSLVIAKIYGFNNDFADRMRRLGIKLRSFPEALKLALKEGRWTSPEGISQYKCGRHETWEGKKIFYRSSYELQYAKQLDEQKVRYEVENLRIEYWDSQELKYRIAIPDFYLCETHTIVEIKSNWTYDKQNMLDRVQKFKELGYNFKLILECVEIEI